MQEPPGGPPDFTPPVILSVTPDSGAVVPQLKDPVLIQFNEVIDERSGGGLAQLITLSPVPKVVDVDWKRTAIAVRPRDGWHPNVVYQLTLLPGIADLRANRLTEPRTIVFSTGGEIPATSITGYVVDWEGGRVAARGLVEAIHQPDSLDYIAVADSEGRYTLASLPPGPYLLVGTADANTNRRRDFREPFDSVTIQLDSLMSRTLWAFRHDTIGPQVSRVTLTDSMTVRVEFNQSLPPDSLPAGAISVLALPDSTPLDIANIWRLPVYDSITQARAAASRDTSQGADTTGGVSRAPQPDTAGVDTTGRRRVAAPRADTARAVPAAPGQPPGGRPPPGAPANVQRNPPQVRDTLQARLLAERPPLSPTVVIRLVAPLSRGSRYLVVASVANLLGAERTSGTVLVVPEAPAPP